MLQEILKSATAANHNELESLMFVNEIMNKTLTLQQYKTLLATNYIVHATLELHLHESLDDDLQQKLDIGKRNKLAALEKDLLEMGMKKEELDVMGLDFLRLQDAGNAVSLGAMYVLEGATLGGYVIHKKLKANPVFENLGLHYYSVYDKNLMPNWLTFVNVLNTSVPASDYTLATESAVNMFSHISEVSKAVKKTVS